MPKTSFLLRLSLIFWMGMALLSAPTALGANSVIWKGKSSGFQIEWTKKDIRAFPLNSDVSVFSLQDFEQKLWKQIRQEPEAKDYEIIDQYRVLSVVGSVLSLRLQGYCDCGGVHPSSLTAFFAFDLSKPGEINFSGTQIAGKRISLEEIFPAEDLYRALMADHFVKQALARSDQPRPKTLAQLMKAISSVPVEVNECLFAARNNSLTNFAFHHTEGDKVAVRIGVSHGSEICRGEATEIGLLLSIPDSLKAALSKASSSEEGFLMKDLQKIAGNQETRLRLAEK